MRSVAPGLLGVIYGILLSINTIVSAQPVNDNFANAIELTELSYWDSPDGAFNNFGATNDGPVPSVYTSLGNNVWFKFQAKTSGMQIDLNLGTMPSTGYIIALFDSNNEIDASRFNLGNVLSSNQLVVGEWYYLSVGGAEGTFGLSLNDQLGNDFRSDAIDITLNGDSWTSSTDAYNNYYSTNDGPAPTAYPSLLRNIWFKFQAQEPSMRVILERSTMPNTFVMALFDENLDEIASTRFNLGHEMVAENLQAGQWYYLSVGSARPPTGSSSTFGLGLEYGNVKNSLEIQALRDLYEGTSGSNWTNSAGWPSVPAAWDTITTIAQIVGWHGITVENGDVKRVVLTSNNLVGPIPGNIGDLPGLTHLMLSDNQLSGTLPGSAFSLANLTHLCVDRNQLSGEIPDGFGQTPRLEILKLHDNNFSGDLPVSLGMLPSLRHLHIANLDLTPGPIPGFLQNNSSLQALHLQGSHRTGEIPGWLQELRDLKVLDISQNNLEGDFPTALNNLTGLTHLNVNSNPLLRGVVPAGIGGLSHLEFFSCSSTSVDEIEPFSHIPDTLHVDDCRLSFSSLEQFFNPGGHPIPKVFSYSPQHPLAGFLRSGFLPSLGSVTLKNFRPDGVYTTYQWQQRSGISWVDLPSATQEDLVLSGIDESFVDNEYRCEMKNSWVPGLTLFSPVYTLELGQASDIVEVGVLKTFYESTNGANWTDNTGWPTTESGWLGLGSKDFKNWYGITVEEGDVVSIDLAGNNLNGNLPNLAGLNRLRYLDLSRNPLRGILGPNLEYLVYLHTLKLAHCGFLGAIDPVFTTLTGLRHLDLSHNHLFGEVPMELLTFGWLETLDLGYNQLSGQLSLLTPFPGIWSLRDVDLSHNHLSGDVSWMLTPLSTLERLDLSHNDFTGIGDHPSTPGLVELDIGHNQLSGPVPPTLLSNDRLIKLYASNNAFEGEVPGVSSSSLKILDLGNNRLTGLAPFSSSWAADSLLLGGNRLTFDVLENQPFVTVPSYYVGYHPQDSVSTYFDLSTLTFSVQSAGNYNRYQWYKNDVPIPGATSDKLVVEESEVNLTNTFHCVIRNDRVASLTLTSRKVFQALPAAAPPVVPTIFWSIKDGDWKDPTIWSHTENGPVANTYPSSGATVYILDNRVHVSSSSYCRSLELIVDKANTELLVSSATLQVNGQIKLSRRSEGYWADVKVLGATGKIRLVE